MASKCINCGGTIIFKNESLSYVCDSCMTAVATSELEGETILYDEKEVSVEFLEKYRRAQNIMEKAVTKNMYTMAAIFFEETNGFLNSYEWAYICWQKATHLRKE